MSLLKRINKYLIENHPLLWHSKFIQLTSAGILFWVLSLFFGYILTDIESIQNTSFADLYAKSYFVFYHVICSLIVLSIWAVSFFKNNAFKSHYPLPRGYFTYLFFLLFIPLLLIISAYIPYTFGAKLKTQSFIEDGSFQSDIDKLNLGFVFIGYDDYDYSRDNPANPNSKYDISHRVYPDPYPLQSIFFNKNINEWSDSSMLIENGDSYTTYFPGDSSNNGNSVQVGELAYQFYKLKTIYPNKDSCNLVNVITKLYRKEELDSPEDNSVLNFSSILINDEYDGTELYKTRYAPLVYKLVRNNDINAIGRIINDFILVCNKYSIGNNLNSAILINYLKEKAFKNLNRTIVNSYQDGVIMDAIGRASSIKNGGELVRFLENNEVFYFRESKVQMLFGNFYRCQVSFLDQMILVVSLAIALLITGIFLCFEFTILKSFLISIPVAGVIGVIMGLLAGFIHDPLYPYLLIFLVIIGVTIFGLYSKKINKKILSVLINLTYYISPFILILLVIIYNEATNKFYYIDKCTHYVQVMEHDSILMEPFALFMVSLAGVLAFFPLLKKWKAYKD